MVPVSNRNDGNIKPLVPLEIEKYPEHSRDVSKNGTPLEPRQDAYNSNKEYFGWLRVNRWLGLSATMIMMGCNGLTYTYAVYSEFIKEKLHYSQERTDDLGAAKDFGAIAGVFSGLFYFFFPPWVSVAIGAFMHFSGYITIVLTLTGRMKTSFWLLCFSSAIGTGGDNWVDTACIMTTLESFKDNKGTAIGILKSQLGLSAAIFIMVYDAFLDSKVVNFLFLITFVPSIVYCGLAFLIRPYSVYGEDTDESDISQRFKMVSVFVLLLGVFLMGSMTLEEIFDLDEMTEMFFAAVMLLLLGMMLVAPVLHKPLDCVRGAFGMTVLTACASDPVLNHKTVLTTDSDEEPGMDEKDTILNTLQSPSLGQSIQVLEDEGGAGLCEHIIADDTNFLYPSLRESLLGIDFWLITLVVSSGAGSGLAIINNFAQIGKAVRSNAVDAFVGIISIWSCFGRLVSGYGSDLMMSAGYSRPVCLLISQIVMCLCCLLLSTGATPFLFIGSAAIGLAYGSYWTLAPTIISEVFGLRQVATLYKFIGLGPMIASYLLSAKVLGYLYDKETSYYQQQHDEDAEENTCYGRRCFEYGLLSLSSVCLAGVFACIWFAYRTRKIYSRTGHVPLPQGQAGSTVL